MREGKEEGKRDEPSTIEDPASEVNGLYLYVRQRKNRSAYAHKDLNE